MSDTKIYLDLSEEIQQLFADNEIDIANVLQDDNVEVSSVTVGVMPEESEEGARNKDLVPIILASSASVAAIGFTISKILNTLKPSGNNTADTFVVRFSLKDGLFMKFHSEVKGESA
ncbi:hypothetical protein QUF74_09220 [Candidatus Halobeggiatoa sp. HSG11]|nr:hypothetical protein [Candidatus Halobeggiatoa sp. HSG11]